MQNLPSITELSSRSVMDKLIDLLGHISVGNGSKKIEILEARLDGLEQEACRHDADEATLAAIKGARVLLGLTGLPLPQIIPRPDLS